MLQILELLPIIAFVVVFKLSGHDVNIGDLHYQLDGIYSATAALMGTTLLQVSIVWLWKRQLEKRLLWMLAIVIICGSATLFFHNSLFIKWKPTLFNWALGFVLLGSHLFTDKNLIERMTGQYLHLPHHINKRLFWIWLSYFFTVGALNLWVAYHFSEATWVNYKLWSAMAFTLAISVVTAIIVAPHLKIEDHHTHGDKP